MEGAVDIDAVLSAESGIEDSVPEEVLQIRELVYGIDGIEIDSKAQGLVDAIREIFTAHPSEKVLIFTQFIETQEYLKNLLLQEGYKVEIFNGGLNPPSKKDEAVERFRQQSQIMISTEAGGEGRNFQFCHIMFNYDLPWNPMRIEQRIGRLDRIGQKKNVYVYNLALEGTIEERVLRVLHERVNIFEENIGALDPILGERVEQSIADLVLGHGNEYSQAFQQFEVDIERKVTEARAAEEKLSQDFILDSRSFRRDTYDKLLGRERYLSNEEIEAFTLAFLGRYPQTEIKKHRDGSMAITVPQAFRENYERAFGEHLGSHDGRYEIRATFDPVLAAERENTLEFIAFGHELFDAVIRFCCDGAMAITKLSGETSARVLQLPAFGGFEGVQFNYVVSFAGGLKETRHLVSIVLDSQGQYNADLSGLVLQNASIHERWPNVDPFLRLKVKELQVASEEKLLDILDADLPVIQEDNMSYVEQQMEKLGKLMRYRLNKAQDVLTRTANILSRMQASSNPDDQRIIPVWQANAEQAQKDIADIELRHDAEKDSIEQQRHVDYSYKLLNAAFIRVVDDNAAGLSGRSSGTQAPVNGDTDPPRRLLLIDAQRSKLSREQIHGQYIQTTAFV